MALVPYRVAGAAADQSLETRLFQVGGLAITIRQDPRASGALRVLGPARDAGGAPLFPSHLRCSRLCVCTSAHKVLIKRLACKTSLWVSCMLTPPAALAGRDCFTGACAFAVTTDTLLSRGRHKLAWRQADMHA